MNPMLTVVIPVYNVAPYLRKCLDSVLASAKTLSEKCEVSSEKFVEVICVDDGSTDGSGEILDEYVEIIGGRGGRGGRGASLSSSSREDGGVGESSSLSSSSRVDGGVETPPAIGKWRRVQAEKKVEEWLEGVDEKAFEEALDKLMGDGIKDGTIHLRNDNERLLITDGARRFFSEFSRSIINLSDSRCVYFAPDPRSRVRGISNSAAWAEYSVHAVTNGGALIPGKEFHSRWYNHRKVENFDLISATLRCERCAPVLKSNPIADSIKFFGKTHEGGCFDVVVRLDEYGNAEANMTEVTFEAGSEKKKRTPRLKPLSEAIEAVVCHQAAGTNPSTVDSSLAHSEATRKGDPVGRDVDEVTVDGGVETPPTADQPTTNSQQPVTLRVIHQKNAGVSAARNAALDVATGEWVMMLDGDDTWASDLLARLFEVIKDHPDCDAVGFGLAFVDADGKKIGELGRNDAAPAVMTGDEVLLDGRGPYSKFIWSSCDKIYRRSTIEKLKLRYTVGMTHGEDSMFSQVFLAYAGQVVLRPDILGYNYYMRSGSAIHTLKTALPKNPFREFEILYSHWEKLRTPGLGLRLYHISVAMPSLGKSEDYAPSVRPQAIEVLLDSKVFNGKIMPFTRRYGGMKAIGFSCAYAVSPRCLRRKLLQML